MTVATPEQVAWVRAERARRRGLQKPHRCAKHQDRESVLFAIQIPGRIVKHRWLCIECASALVGLHGATLRRP